MTRHSRRQRGQTIVEYVLIIAIVVVASVSILGVFSDMLRDKIAGICKVFSPSADVTPADTPATDIMKDLDKNGLDGS